MSTWKGMIEEEMEEHGDKWDDTVGVQLPDGDDVDNGWHDVVFNSGFKAWHQGVPFALWTEDWVYFAKGYDGAESVGSVPRNPETKGYEPDHIE